MSDTVCYIGLTIVWRECDAHIGFLFLYKISSPPNILNYKCLLSPKFAGTMHLWSDLAEWLGQGLLRGFYWLELWLQDSRICFQVHI